MDIGICSYSFHRLLAAGKQDIFRFITDCAEMGCSQLDPWNAHLAPIRANDDAIQGQSMPRDDALLAPAEVAYLDRVRQAAQSAGLPFGLIAVDGAHIYEADPVRRTANRVRAYRWLEVAHRLGASQIRIDAGGPEDMPPDIFAIIREGYLDIIARGRDRGVEILVENHWGPTLVPDQVIRLVEGVPGLGLLLDTHNWKKGLRDDGRRRCAHLARATHIKTLDWDASGAEKGEDVAGAIEILHGAGFHGPWGIESVPADGDEYAGVHRTIQLLHRLSA